MKNTSVVIGIRIPRKLKEELDKLGINYSKEIRVFLEKRVREEKMKKIIAEIERLRESIGKVDENLAAKLIREDRDSR